MDGDEHMHPEGREGRRKTKGERKREALAQAIAEEVTRAVARELEAAAERQGKAKQLRGGEYMTLDELARHLEIGRGSAWSLVIERGEIPHVRVSDRVIRLARRDVEEYIASRRVEAAG
ncbi:MAG: helix-turn-helix domain-containing protein [Actinomycetota bacterium]|nr:helix-turn-helix domain-containing protein [Actinomycetota bacterium]